MGAQHFVKISFSRYKLCSISAAELFAPQTELIKCSNRASPLVTEVFLDLHVCRRGNRLKTNMSTLGDVHVRICGQEIIKYDLDIKALIQVRL